jgi:hypothetical protein
MRAGKNSRLRMNVPSTSPPKGASRAPLVYAGKNKVRYFLNTPRITGNTQRHESKYSTIGVFCVCCLYTFAAKIDLG